MYYINVFNNLKLNVCITLQLNCSAHVLHDILYYSMYLILAAN